MTTTVKKVGRYELVKDVMGNFRIFNTVTQEVSPFFDHETANSLKKETREGFTERCKLYCNELVGENSIVNRIEFPLSDAMEEVKAEFKKPGPSQHKWGEMLSHLEKAQGIFVDISTEISKKSIKKVKKL